MEVYRAIGLILFAVFVIGGVVSQLKKKDSIVFKMLGFKYIDYNKKVVEMFLDSHSSLIYIFITALFQTIVEFIVIAWLYPILFSYLLYNKLAQSKNK